MKNTMKGCGLQICLPIISHDVRRTIPPPLEDVVPTNHNKPTTPKKSNQKSVENMSSQKEPWWLNRRSTAKEGPWGLVTSVMMTLSNAMEPIGCLREDPVREQSWIRVCCPFIIITPNQRTNTQLGFSILCTSADQIISEHSKKQNLI